MDKLPRDWIRVIERRGQNELIFRMTGLSAFGKSPKAGWAQESRHKIHFSRAGFAQMPGFLFAFFQITFTAKADRREDDIEQILC